MKGKSIGVGIGVALALAMVAVGAWAQGEPETYLAYVNNSSGTIHMVEEGESCHENETLIEWNQVGLQGPQAQQEPQGELGSPEVLGFYKRSTTGTVCGNYCQFPIQAMCDPGDIVAGGGYGSDFQSVGDWSVMSSRPREDLGAWQVTVRNHSLQNIEVRVYAICADLTPTPTSVAYLAIIRKASPQGPPGVLGLYRRSTTGTVCGNYCQLPIDAMCDAGDIVTGGGYGSDFQSVGDWCVNRSGPREDLGAWQVTVRNHSLQDIEVRVYAICADLTP